MKKNSLFVSILLLLVCSLAHAEIKVSAAISLKESLTKIASDYEAATHEKVTLNFGASGALMGQIRNGAPVDVFISAATQQVDDLSKENLTRPESRRVIADNTLVLVVPADAKDAPRDFKDLADARFAHISIGEPKTVPAGQYASQVFDHLKLTDSIKPRLVFGSNVRQVLTYVEHSEVSAGVVYATDAKVAGDKIKIVATAPSDSHDPIQYPGVILKDSKSPEVAAKFLDYLGTDGAKKVLTDAGFTVPAK